MAIWEKLFSKITFKDYPDTSTPLNADNLNKMTDAIDGIDNRVVELNSNLSYKGNYTSNIDELHGLDKCGGYWCQATVVSGDVPFDSQYYYLEVPIESGGRLQRATQYITGETKERCYANGRWYPWSSKLSNLPDLMQSGKLDIVSSTSEKDYTVTFDKQFSSVSSIQLTVSSYGYSNNTSVVVKSYTPTTLTFTVISKNANVNQSIYWLVVGK